MIGLEVNDIEKFKIGKMRFNKFTNKSTNSSTKCLYIDIHINIQKKTTNDLQTSYKGSQKNLQKCHNLVDKTKFLWYLVDRPRGHKKTNQVRG